MVVSEDAKHRQDTAMLPLRYASIFVGDDIKHYTDV